MYKKWSKPISFLLVLVTNLKIVENIITILNCFFLVKNNFKYNSYFSYSFNI